MSDKLFYLLQINDALFPIGGYSHSQGLETYIQKGIVHDQASAARYLQQKLCWSTAPAELLAVRLVHEYAATSDLCGILRIETLLDASRIPAEQRDASRKMGARFAKTMGKLELPIPPKSIFHQYLQTREGTSINHCCIYGVFCAAMEISLEETLTHYLYAQTSAMATNCVKTVPLSQSTGQKLLSACYPCMQELIQQAKGQTEDDLCLSAPGFDIRGIQHERLYSRIYMS